MRRSRFFIPTVREVPADAEIASHQLMIRAGMIRKVAAGIYDLLPFGLRAIRKVEGIIRQEMEKAGAQETLLPSLIPAELWKETDRWDFYGKELLRITDRHNNEFCFGPTHEEVMTDLVRREIRSYKQLPINLYQIQTKFRDEIRPRFGMMRAREFLMKDGYSFDVDEEAAKQSYQGMFDAYNAIFTRAGLRFRSVEADTGQIGGASSHEFMVLAKSGEDTIASCGSCSYASNIEKAELLESSYKVAEAGEELPTEEVATPTEKTIEEVSSLLNKHPEQFIKTIVYALDGGERFCVALVRGDYEINEPKLMTITKAAEIELAEPEKVKQIAGADVGFIGPVGLKADDEKVTIIADYSIRTIRNGVTGANKNGYHIINVNLGRDFTPDDWADIRTVAEGDVCPRCEDRQSLKFDKGIEVGHIFLLGTRYSEKMKAKYLNNNGREQTAVMGTYGIGIGRTVAASIEQNHDENGIIWPMGISPFDVVVLPLNMKKELVTEEASRIEKELEAAGLEVLLDDLDERPGVKFTDADLTGMPIQVVVGEKGLKNGELEIKLRKSGERITTTPSEVVAKVIELVAELKA